jgi:tetratricopeptide (TPR) repeat protein
MAPAVIALFRWSLAFLFGLLVTACVMPGGGAPPSSPDSSADLNRQLAQAHRQLGLGLEAAGDITGAVDEYEAAFDRGSWPANAATGEIENTPYGDLARICRSADSMQLVIRACIRVIASFRFSQGDLAEFLVNRADAYYRLSDMNRASRDYETALELETSNPRALFGRGRIKALAGSHVFALVDFNRAIGAGLDHPDIRYARAMSLVAVDDFEGAIDDFDHVLSDPEGLAAYPDAYRDRAQAHCQTGQAAAAAIDWQVWLDATPGGGAEVQEMLMVRGYLDGPATEDFGPAALAALRTWTEAGCPEAG